MNVIIFLIALWFILWLGGKIIHWVEKKIEAIRDRVANRVANEVLADIDIKGKVNNYKEKLNHINYKREDIAQKLRNYYKVKEFGSYADFYSNLGHCPECKDGNLKITIGIHGKFIGCSNYPKCKYIKSIKIAKSQYRENINKEIIQEIKTIYS
jgi:DNA topoisomerase-1